MYSKTRKRTVSVLITWDVDPMPFQKNRRALLLIKGLLDTLKVKSTFYFPAKVAEELTDEVKMLVGDGHEIGCHGLTHDSTEEFDKLKKEKQIQILKTATQILQSTAQCSIKSFRGPRVKTSHVTQEILETLGYTSDSSVCSQRLDLVSSNLFNFGWVYSPRLPYHPHIASPYRRGSRNLWVVPVSSIVLPFISSTLYTFRSNVMKIFFSVLYLEAKYTGKPIVYLAHPYEFIDKSFTRNRNQLSMLQSIRTHGFPFRRKLYEKNKTKRRNLNYDLLSYIKSFPDVRFLSVSEFIESNLLKI